MKREPKPRQSKGARPASGVRAKSKAWSRSRTRYVPRSKAQSGPFVAVTTAIRAWVEPHKARKRQTKSKPPWRPQPYGTRVLVFDTETTTDAAQRLLFGFFRLYERDRLILEGLIVTDLLDYDAMMTLSEYAAKCRLPIYSRERFVEEVFYPEVYAEGTLCIGFNLPFDLARIAVHAGTCRGENRRKFRIKLSNRIRWHDLRIESASGRAAFIGFTPKRKLLAWEKPFFNGRFLDLSTLSAAFTGNRHTLKTAGRAFRAYTRKMAAPEFGSIDRRSLLYGRQDVRATWALYKALRTEYARHPFATFAHERAKPKTGRYMGELYSSASIAKQYLRCMGIKPLLQKQPRFPRKLLGKGAASYFGGRADVRVRKADVPVQVLDFTSNYATIFSLARLDRLLVAPKIGVEVVTPEVQAFLTPSEGQECLLFESRTWRKLNCLVLVDPNWAILPVRFRQKDQDPFTIAVTPLETPEGRWYTLADVLASELLGGPAPEIRRAIRFVPRGRHHPKSVLFRNTVQLRSNTAFFKPIVEHRQVARLGAKDDPELAALERGLKEMAASGAYGIYAEINVTPIAKDKELPGEAYSDVSYTAQKVHDERPGTFANPIIASLITGGARLLLAMLESEVTKRGGTFPFCDTDSLAIVSGNGGSPEIPCLAESAVSEIIAKFDRLSPYDSTIVPHLLKLEYAEISDLRCFAVSAKRYVLFRWRPGRRIEIVKASESALGAIIGRTPNESTKRLARRIWLAILMQHLEVNPQQRCRAKPLIDFDVPLRRKFPISQPSILDRMKIYNKSKAYDHRVKPFGFVQTVSATVKVGAKEFLPIAPFERDLGKSKRLAWVDFNTGEPIRLDWHGSHMHGTIPVMRLSQYIEGYQDHPEAKAADRFGRPAGPETTGLLQRLKLRSKRLQRIGKEVDRLDQEEGASLEPAPPVEYQRDDLADDIDYLAAFPREPTARDLGLTVRGWFKLINGLAAPRDETAARIREVAAEYRLT
jgi:hypothetical protein